MSLGGTLNRWKKQTVKLPVPNDSGCVDAYKCFCLAILCRMELQQSSILLTKAVTIVLATERHQRMRRISRIW